MKLATSARLESDSFGAPAEINKCNKGQSAGRIKLNLYKEAGIYVKLKVNYGNLTP